MNDEGNEKSNISTDSTNEDSSIVSILNEIQKRLSFLERKIDTLLNQPPVGRPAFQQRGFSKGRKPFRKPFGRFGGMGEGGNKWRRDQGPKDGNAVESQPMHFDKARGEKNQGFAGRKKWYAEHSRRKFNKKPAHQ